MPFRRFPLALALAGVMALFASTAMAQICPNVSGSPIKLSPSKHYFQNSTGTIPLVGMSHEYICHILMPTAPVNLKAKYCALQNYTTRFTEMQNNKNNVIRLEAIFNHSPGWMSVCDDTVHNIDRCPGADACCGAKFTDEQPFRYDTDAQKWSLSKKSGPNNNTLVPDLNDKYLENLEKVVCDAYGKGPIIVEVSLFNVWDGRWETSPFNRANTLRLNNKAQGFSSQALFMTLGSGDQQDTEARNAQMGAVAAVVNRLKKYPNVIWEVANEPDFVRDSAGVTKEQVFAWQQAVVQKIIDNDPAPGNPPPGQPQRSAHLIEIEGHSSTTFAWNEPRASVEAAHYTETHQAGTTHGAISLLQNLYPTISTKGVAVSFNENRTFPNNEPDTPASDIRGAAEARSEAWEFAIAGGALFDNYSVNYGDPETPKLRSQLKSLSDFLNGKGTVVKGPKSLDEMRQASCNTAADWCTGVPMKGQDESGTGGCTMAGSKVYWSTLKAETASANDYALYVHHGKAIHTNGAGGYKAISCGNGSSSGYKLPNLQFRISKAGCYLEQWTEPETGLQKFGTYRNLQSGLYPALGRSMPYKQDILIFLTRVGNSPCPANASLTPSYTFTCNKVQCNFDASASSPNAVIGEYAWDWGDGTSSSSSSPMAQHVYATPGNYKVTLTASSSQNDAEAVSQTLAVSSQPPTPGFTMSCSSLTCTFDGGSSQGADSAVVHWSWSFGDGGGAAGVSPAYTFALGGSYPVTLTVTDGLGVSSSLTQTVTVNGPPPTASFIATCSGLSCDFDASYSTAGNQVTYSWTFGDGTSGTGTNPNHSYAVKGTYSVVLTVADTLSRQSTFQKVLTVTSDTPLPGESYFAVPPCRLLDTRIAPLTAMNSGQTYTFQISGKCGIPSTAKAVSVSATAVAPTGAGTVSLFPTGQTPTFNILDFDPARSPRAVNTIAQLATDATGTLGAVAAVAGTSGQVHLVLDVDGYFSEDTTPAAGAQGPLGYQTITPCRLVDTRTTNTPLTSGVLRTFSIQGNCGIPVGAAAAALNAAIVSPTNLGYLALYPSSLPTAPVVSNLNWVAGTTALTNGARPLLSSSTPSDLATKLFLGAPGTTAHVVLDTMGYFKSGAPYKYHPIAPCRAAHTGMAGEGAPSLAAGTTRSFQIQGNCGVPVGAKAAFISTKVLAGGTTTGGLLLLFPSGGSSNGTAFATFDAGEPALAGGAIVELSNNPLDISVSSSSNLDLSIKVLGYFQ